MLFILFCILLFFSTVVHRFKQPGFDYQQEVEQPDKVHRLSQKDVDQLYSKIRRLEDTVKKLTLDFNNSDVLTKNLYFQSIDHGVHHMRINIKVKLQSTVEETPSLLIGGAEWRLGFEMEKLTIKIYIKYFQKEKYKWLNNRYVVTFLVKKENLSYQGEHAFAPTTNMSEPAAVYIGMILWPQFFHPKFRFVTENLQIEGIADFRVRRRGGPVPPEDIVPVV